MPPTLFISYAGPDRATAIALHAALRAAGLEPWCDAVDLQPGDRWDEVIPSHLKASAVAAVLISHHWPEVGEPGAGYYGPEEVAIAIDRARQPGARLRIVPIRLDGVGPERVPFGLRRIADIEARRDALHVVAERLDPLLARPDTAAEARPEPRARLTALKRRRAQLEASGAAADAIEAVTHELLALKRTLRAGGALSPGDVLADRYVLGERLGHGGFASVWRAWDERAERLVAVKVLHGRWSHDKTRVERFDRGARKMAGLAHPAVVEVLDPHAECDGWHFFVMTYLSGGNLHEAVTREEAPLSVDDGLRAVLAVAEALGAAHGRGMVHRDVKPENIVLDGAGDARLTDFDLVRVADSTGGTGTGALGTFVYAAPEQFDRPQDAGPAADVYGLGMTAVFVLTGVRPPMMSKWTPEATAEGLPAPPALRALVGRAIAVDPAARPADGAAFARALRAVLEARGAPPIVGSDASARLPDTPRAAPSAAGALTPGTSTRPALVSLGPGDFIMGSPASEAGRWDRERAHRVTLTRGLWMAETVVTQAQYHALMGRNPSEFQGTAADADRPVETVSWFDAVAWCNALSAAEGLEPAYAIEGESVTWDRTSAGYRLPTEAEWEYAARAGTTTATYAGDVDIVGANNAPVLDDIAWYGGNSGSEHPKAWDSSGWPDKQYPHERASTQPVRGKRPTAWGLYDMLGNVWEWTWDRYTVDPSGGGPEVDPAGPPRGDGRVIRGGSFDGGARGVRAANRDWWHPAYRVRWLGFRPVRFAAPPPRAR